MAEVFDHGHAGHHPAAEGGAVAVVKHLQDLGTDACHVDVGWAFAFAAFAGEAAVEYFFEQRGGVGMVGEATGEDFAQDVGAGAGGEEFVAGLFEGGAHGAADGIAFAAVAGTVALLDAAHEVAVVAEVGLVEVVAE